MKGSDFDDGGSHLPTSKAIEFLPDIVKQLVREDDESMPSADRGDDDPSILGDWGQPRRNRRDWDSDRSGAVTMSLEDIGEFDIETPGGMEKTENILQRYKN
jgi:hypothetical protein